MENNLWPPSGIHPPTGLTPPHRDPPSHANNKTWTRGGKLLLKNCCKGGGGGASLPSPWFIPKMVGRTCAGIPLTTEQHWPGGGGTPGKFWSLGGRGGTPAYHPTWTAQSPGGTLGDYLWEHHHPPTPTPTPTPYHLWRHPPPLPNHHYLGGVEARSAIRHHSHHMPWVMGEEGGVCTEGTAILHYPLCHHV